VPQQRQPISASSRRKPHQISIIQDPWQTLTPPAMSLVNAGSCFLARLIHDMKNHLAFFKLVLPLVASWLLSGVILAQAPVAITIDPNAPDAAIPERFSGLSYEMAIVLPDQRGRYYFSSANKHLVEMFRTLGIKMLRVGGNTADRPGIKFPEPPDLDNLFAFAQAAGVKVIFTLRLRESNPEDAVKVARYVMEHYKSDVVCFAIGNEPNVFAKTYDAYREELDKYMASIIAVAPDAKFCGPSTTPGKAVWACDLANDYGHSGRIALITQHDYPGGSARKVTDTAAARDNMLSPAWLKHYEKFHDSFAPAAVSNRLAFRLEEANSFYNGGAKDVSDTFAAALWGLDYLYWWASHGADGINFHTGDSVAAGEENTPCRYASFRSSTSGYSVMPVGYALKAFDVGSHGQIVPLTFASNTEALNLTAYGVLAADKSVYVTIINKEHGAGARDAAVTLVPGDSYASGEMICLASLRGNVAATSEITFGGAPIRDDATWKGTWTPLSKPSPKGEFALKVPAATAAIIKLATQ
jgi:hypothetical protein